MSLEQGDIVVLSAAGEKDSFNKMNKGKHGVVLNRVRTVFSESYEKGRISGWDEIVVLWSGDDTPTKTYKKYVKKLK